MSEEISAPAIVLVRPQEEGNVGAAARAMANMGLKELVLVEPAPAFGPVARAFAVGAGFILDTTRRAGRLDEALAPYQRIVATTAARARHLPAPAIHPAELHAELAEDPFGTSTAVVFGPESSGLNNEELALASAVVSIPCSPVQPTLNLAQAVLIVAYELAQARLREESEAIPEDSPLASQEEIEGLFVQAENILAAIGFARDDTFAGVRRDLRRLLARSRPTTRDVSLLRGICRRTLYALPADRRPASE